VPVLRSTISGTFRRAVIIVADDFGVNAVINSAIEESLRKGFCSNASLMANMPGFEEACELIRRNGWADRIGLHLVLRDGPPLTHKIRRFPRFCGPDGQLRLRNHVPRVALSAPERDALAEEIRAQIRRCRDQGISLCHLDSHYHLHTEWAIASVLIPIVKEERIPRVRLSRNCGRNLSLAKRLYKTVFNKRIQSAGLAGMRYFGSLDDYRNSRARLGSFEIMVHPALAPDGTLLWEPGGEPLEQALRQLGLLTAENLIRAE
jgi:chitin disaccharide deacetylase